MARLSGAERRCRAMDRLRAIGDVIADISEQELARRRVARALDQNTGGGFITRTLSLLRRLRRWLDDEGRRF